MPRLKKQSSDQRRTRQTAQREIRRQDDTYRMQERARDAEAHLEHRHENEVFRSQERRRDAEAHSVRRHEDEVFRSQERRRNTEAHSVRRHEDEVFRSQERRRDAEAHSVRRHEDEVFRSQERRRDAEAHSVRRHEDEVFRSQERKRDGEAHSVRRQNIDVRRTEQLRNSAQRLLARQQSRLHEHDQRRMANCRVMLHRYDATNRANESERQSQRNRSQRQLSIEDREESLLRDRQRWRQNIVYNFTNAIKQGPTEVCVCCGGTWFLSQVKLLNMETIQQKYSHNNITSLFYLSDIFPNPANQYKFCNTCYRLVSAGKTPKICLSEGLDFPEIPECLQGLTCLEERLIAPRIPFMRIIALGYDRQSALRGAVVNIPISVDQVVSALPRTFDNTHVIQLHLKRRLEYNRSFMTETIRPAVVFQALQYLIDTELYRKHNISIAEDWLSVHGHAEEVPFIANQEDTEIVHRLLNAQQVPNDEQEYGNDDLNPGGQETLLENEPIENLPINQIAIAPGEGRRPTDITADTDAEELSYPTIYCGVKRRSTATFAKIARSEIRRYDRRCARIDKLLWTYKYYELQRVKNSISICLRKQCATSAITVANINDDNFVDSLVKHDDGYRILKGLRTSPAHWESEKKKVIAMIRQFGLPTFFITLSAAESKWVELLVVLSLLIDKKTISEEEAAALPTIDKFRLIRSDPVTCSRYFDHRFRQLFKVMKFDIFSEYPISFFYWRIEFQHRGSPHCHGMYWLENAPQLNPDNSSSTGHVVDFIDQFISTDGQNSELLELLAYQKHRHGRSCRREIRGHTICRFNMPYPPMPKTEILFPFPDGFAGVDILKAKYAKIREILNNDMTEAQVVYLNVFENFLAHEDINISYDEYIRVLRSTLKKPQVFLKRKFQDKLLNAYNPKILGLYKANMDIQFILDAYACCSYIINYINKSNRGVSLLLREAMDEINEGNFSIRQKLQHIGNKFINGTEISAQEAAYNILGLHISETSNAEVYVNTSRLEQRVRMVKSKKDLQDLPSESTEIYVPNLIDHYVQRPDQLENTCLADFAALYRYFKSDRKTAVHNDDYDEVANEDNEENNLSGRLRLKNNNGFIQKRTKPCVLRWRRFSVETAREDYFREMVMLFYHWRNEQLELINNDNEQTCCNNTSIIEENRRRYNQFEQNELEEVLLHLREEQQDQQLNEEQIENDEAVTQIYDDEFRALALPEVSPNVNVLYGGENSDDADGRIYPDDEELRLIRLPPLIPEDHLASMIRSLNIKQRQYLAHVLHNDKEKTIYNEYVGGGAGVGKSLLINVIYQSLLKRANSTPSTDPMTAKVLLCAPTGKAAFGIGGLTLHSTFSLPVNQSSAELRPLSSDVVNRMFTKLLDLKLIIIDEISMVGSKMFSQFDSRLKQIFKSNQTFGGISVIVFGDLKQLPPVGDKWIFSQNTNDAYSAINGASLWNNFKFFELTEIMRQREDRDFALALNNMSEGKMTDADVNLISQRVVISDVPSEAIHLFWSNKETNAYNTAKLGLINTNQYVSIAKDVIKAAAVTSGRRNQIGELVKLFKTSETQGLPYEVLFKTSAKYMVTVNINTIDGIVNGATGILMQVDLAQNDQTPSTLWIKFAEATVGSIARSKKPHPCGNDWTPIEKVVRSFQFKKNEQVSIQRLQFPVVLAEAITIHKSQGATYSQVAVHLKSTMSRAALYVACSRATSAGGLFLMGNFVPPKPFGRTDVVKHELCRLRTDKSLTTQFDFMLNRSTMSLQVLYQNVQSLHAHIEDIRKDQLLLSSDILCFVETWTITTENYDIPGFEIFHRIDSDEDDNGRHKNGLIIYIKSSLAENVHFHFKINFSWHGSIFQRIAFNHNNINFYILYKNPSFSVNLFRNLLLTDVDGLLGNQNENICLLGDFNICRATNQDILETKLREKGLSSLLPTTTYTTSCNTQIDWVFSNIDQKRIQVTTYETLYSYHDAICFLYN